MLRPFCTRESEFPNYKPCLSRNHLYSDKTSAGITFMEVAILFFSFTTGYVGCDVIPGTSDFWGKWHETDWINRSGVWDSSPHERQLQLTWMTLRVQADPEDPHKLFKTFLKRSQKCDIPISQLTLFHHQWEPLRIRTDGFYQATRMFAECKKSFSWKKSNPFHIFDGPDRGTCLSLPNPLNIPLTGICCGLVHEIATASVN